MRCIYCGRREASGREHWIQRGLGTFRNFTPLVDRLCEQCNQRLGRELDEEFLRTGQIGFHRVVHGIQGRDTHRPVNHFLFRGMAPQQPNVLMMPVPHAPHRVLGEAYLDAQGNKATKPLRQLVVRTRDGEIRAIPFNRAWTVEQLRQAVAGRALLDATVFEVYFEDDEGAREAITARELVRQIFPDLSQATAFMGLSQEREVRTVSLAAGMTTNYMRALVKNAFHYTLWACPLVTGAEDAFTAARRFISEGEGSSRDFVELNVPHFIPQIQEGYVPERTSHFFTAEVRPGGVSTQLQYFIGPEGRPRPVRVQLGTRATALDASWLSCHQAQYFAAKTEGFDGELIEIPVADRQIILP